ncbi:MAG: molecular chaperone DnaK [Kiritimatiellia bacterium]|jgi:molecular chaperone DnaK
MARAIGIDLGTTNSCAALIEGGQPKVITYSNGEKTIPSVFAIDKSGNRLVGQEAQEQASANPENTVQASKRLIGRTYGSKQMEKMKQVFTYELVEGESSEVLIRVKDQVFTLEQISAAILRRIKENAEEAIGDEVDQAVITVPAYFNDRQRQAVRSAGKLAGLKVLRVLNEPTAAALAYGLGRTLNQRVAIYDLGGGTFDMSIIDIKDKIFEVIATGGDTFLGGVDFDDRLMQHILGIFLTETSIDLSYDRKAVTRVRQQSELVKIALSESTSEELFIPAICEEDGEVHDLRITITREELENLTRDLVDRSIRTCERILEEAKCGREKLDEILLVGGQSRMPLVRREVSAFLGRPPSQKVHPDEAVAIGAAIMAHSLVARGAGMDMTLLDVLPMAIGISKVNGTMHVLFPKNQPLPHFETRTLTTSKNEQRSIMLRIYQGESKFIAENELLGTFVFSGLRPAPKGEVKVEVTFDIDSEGILNLSARDLDTGHLVESRLKLGKDNDESRKRRKKKKKKAEEEKAAAPPTPLSMPMSTLGSVDDELGEDSAFTEPSAPDRGASPLSEEVRKADEAAPIGPPPLVTPSVPDPRERPNDALTTDRPGVWARFKAWLSRIFRRKQ